MRENRAKSSGPVAGVRLVWGELKTGSPPLVVVGGLFVAGNRLSVAVGFKIQNPALS